MQPDKKDLQIAERFKALLIDHGMPLVKTVIFGSRARGDADLESDLDMLVVVDHLTPHMEKEIGECAWEVSFDTGIIIQTVIMTTARLQGPEKSSLLMLAIDQEGILV